MKVVYSLRYSIGFLGVERLHPFDSRKYGRAWRRLGRDVRALRNRAWVGVPRPASWDELAAIHARDYLNQLNDRAELPAALEHPVLRRLPAWLTRWIVLRPMRRYGVA